MRSIVGGLALILIPASTLAAQLPLDDGDYTWGACNAGSSDYSKSFDVQSEVEGPHKGRRLLYPTAENQDGGCAVVSMKASGSTFSGSSRCEDGGSRMRYNTGIYKFSLTVLDSRTFISKGKKYVWCARSR